MSFMWAQLKFKKPGTFVKGKFISLVRSIFTTHEEDSSNLSFDRNKFEAVMTTNDRKPN